MIIPTGEIIFLQKNCTGIDKSYRNYIFYRRKVFPTGQLQTGNFPIGNSYLIIKSYGKNCSNLIGN